MCLPATNGNEIKGIEPGCCRGSDLAVAPYITGVPGSHATHAARSRVQTECPHLLNLIFVPFAGIAIAAYLLGSIPTGYLLYRIFRRQDIRSMGSGNIGATNVMRAGGKGLGAATFALDVLKGCAAVWLGGWLASLWMPSVPLRTAEAFAALFAVLGHMFPVWLRFRGGKGVATGFGVFLVASPMAGFGRHRRLRRRPGAQPFVSVASIVAAFSFPIFAWLLVTGSRPPFFFVAELAVSLLIIVKHHPNIRRLYSRH